jgi:phosphoadenosine phosphosulfate reductase
MLVQETVTGRIDKVQKAVDRIKTFEPKEGYWLAFSGGKDSQCIYHLAKMADVKFEAHYSVTTVDPPELLKFIKENYPDVIWDYPVDKYGRRTCMYRLISEHTIPPTRMARYCCDELKESKGTGRLVITGVRWAESNRRRGLHGVVDVRTSSKKLISEALGNNPAAKLNNRNSLVFMDDNEDSRRMVEHCYIAKRTTLNPIVDWEDDDVWEFLNDVAKVPHCCLYDEGRTRIGCVGCPLQGRDAMMRDFERWPGFKRMYIKAFDEMIKNHPGEIRIATGEKAEPGGGAYAPGMGRMVRPLTGKDGLIWRMWMHRGQQDKGEPSSIRC